MHVDALTLATLADEWRTLLRGARIDTIIAPTEYALALQCYAPSSQGSSGGGGHNRWLYLSAHPQLARAHITALKPPKIVNEPSPFVMLLRKYLEGARIESIEQPRWERVVELIAGHRAGPDTEERIHYRLIVEIMGRMSNIIFCDEQGLILGSLKRVGAEVNRYRVIAANVQYVPPPPQQRLMAGKSLPKLEPTTLTPSQLVMCAAEEPPTESEAPPPAEKTRQRKPQKPQQAKLWQLLTQHLLGFSPLVAREAVYRATGNAETALERSGDEDAAHVWEELARHVRELGVLYDNYHWRPQLVERVGPVGSVEATSTGVSSSPPVPVAFAPYVLEQYAQLPGMQIRESPSMNVLLDDYYARTEWRDAMEGVRSPLRKILQTQRDRCKRKADILQKELAALDEAAQYRLQAELLLAHQHDVPQGQSSVVLQNFFVEASEESFPRVTISLDPRFDAVGNANRLFNKYHKLRRAAALVPGQIEQNAAELATIEQMLADLMLAENPAEVVLVKAEVQTAGYLRGKPMQEKKSQVQIQKAGKKGKAGKGGKQTKGKGKPVPPGGGVPLHMQSRDGFTLLVGKNSRQNEEVTFHQATAMDLWLHARGVPGAHVIIKAAGREIPHSTIEQAASLAAYYSQARGSTGAPVDYTLQRYVRHMKGGGPGMVVYERERTLYVEPLSFS